MSDDELYMKTGELPPQGIGSDDPDKSVIGDSALDEWEFSQYIQESVDRSMVGVIDADENDMIVVLETSMRDGYDKNMGESLRWCAHWMCRDLEDRLGTGDLHERAQLKLIVRIPKATFCNCLKAPAMDEQEGVGHED